MQYFCFYSRTQGGLVMLPVYDCQRCVLMCSNLVCRQKIQKSPCKVLVGKLFVCLFLFKTFSLDQEACRNQTWVVQAWLNSDWLWPQTHKSLIMWTAAVAYDIPCMAMWQAQGPGWIDARKVNVSNHKWNIFFTEFLGNGCDRLTQDCIGRCAL